MGTRKLIPALALVVALAGPACTYSTSREGNDRFLRSEVAWQPGATTLNEVLSKLGPPDLIRRRSDEMIFVYRFRQEVKTSFLISFYLNLLSLQRAEQTDTTLVVTFDRSDVLISRAFDVGSN